MRVGLNLNYKVNNINFRLNNKKNNFYNAPANNVYFKGKDEFIKTNCPIENYTQLEDVKKMLPDVRTTSQNILSRAAEINPDKRSEVKVDLSNDEKSEVEQFYYHPNGKLQRYFCHFVSKKNHYTETEEYRFKEDGSLMDFSLKQSRKASVFDEQFFTFDVFGVKTHSSHREITNNGTLEYITKVDFDINNSPRNVTTERKIFPRIK